MMRACWRGRMQFAVLDAFGRGWGNAGTLEKDSHGRPSGKVDSGRFFNLRDKILVIETGAAAGRSFEVIGKWEHEDRV